MAVTIEDPLPSWNDSDAKSAIMDFVARVTTEGGADYVSVNARIAVFDNDGTLWCEQPVPVETYFAAADAARLAGMNAALAAREPFKSLIAGDLKAVAEQGVRAVAEIMKVAHSGTTADEFAATVRDWLYSADAVHPKTGRRFLKMVYQPMLEVLDYLRASDFATFIVSGGGADFMRVFAEESYGIPPYRVIGSTFKSHFELRDNQTPALVLGPGMDLYDDKAAKPVAIHKYIGTRPLACFGNSDGDREMLMLTTLGRPDGRRGFGLIVHHTDAEREFEYDREHVPSGRLDKALDEAPGRGWVLVDMKRDWKMVFPPRRDAERGDP